MREKQSYYSETFYCVTSQLSSRSERKEKLVFRDILLCGDNFIREVNILLGGGSLQIVESKSKLLALKHNTVDDRFTSNRGGEASN